MALMKYQSFPNMLQEGEEICNTKPYQANITDTSRIYQDLNFPQRFECPWSFNGYGIQKPRQHPFYKTTSSEYGYYTPNTHTVPHRYFATTNKFSTHLAQCGMYRNYSLNTVMDKSLY